MGLGGPLLFVFEGSCACRNGPNFLPNCYVHTNHSKVSTACLPPLDYSANPGVK
jgi:hypothetical protein